ncbi:hypothetical protein [Devosia sp.]|uniref:hypothetical protein n=1 Tax=Devosia sp. TaxID=1871048 RepID=UPI003A8DB210
MRLATWGWLLVALVFAVIATFGEAWVTDRRPPSTLMLNTIDVDTAFARTSDLRQRPNVD